MQPIGLMFCCLAAGAVICVILYWFSYNQEKYCTILGHTRKKNKKEAKLDEESQHKPSLPTKVFKDSTAQCREEIEGIVQQMMDQDDEEAGNNNNNGLDGSTSSRHSNASSCSRLSGKERRATELTTAPRCVLCSKQYTVGECVTHSNNPKCHHEFHEHCLNKHWTRLVKKAKKNKTTAEEEGKCPVCKEPYVIEKLAPSKHFSTLRASNLKSVKASTVVAPFDAPITE